MASELDRMQVFNVRSFGARGDSRTIDTAAIQAAVGACSAAGGGAVYCPPGVYRTGSVQLQSHMRLYLEAGAVLLASTDRKDYPPVDIRGIPENTASYGLEHLLWARNAHNVTISGAGIIDGNGDNFFGEPGHWSMTFRTIRSWRPWQLVALIECQDVTIEGVTFRDAPGWTIWPFACDRVFIRGIRILNRRNGPNTDGIDPDCCKGVIISDCHIEVGDDCIAVKSGIEKLDAPRPCEDIVVTNCVMKTPCCAVRIGYEGDGAIRNCSFSNLTMTETRTGINILVPRVPEVPIHHGTPIENISFNNIAMDLVCPFFIWIGDEALPPGAIRNLSFSNIRGRARRASYLGGSRTIPIENLRLSGIDLAVSGEMDEEFACEVPYPYRVWDYYTKKGIPHALYLRHVRDLALTDVRLRWAETSGPWRSAVRIEESEDLSIANLSASGCAACPEAAAVHLSHVRRAMLSSCRGLPSAGPFLRVDGERTKAVSLLNCDLAASRGVELGKELGPDAFAEAGNRLAGRGESAPRTA